ncbi:helix-turn-helix domain-containing protein [Dyadobacter sp. CY343]|uniref:helix-turn-helix domain-containing protein n=1 Tax=Dyadobacter sp. CY343 TaxID=2907299 RepID=UPI001F1D13DC|nr:helix-turn-helix transcriptional regulator [Dyadobacter sp. CY343]MCE7061227.1 helix-turn-helix domain-containing protein [Dyadobacter sp. CY343]
MENNVSERIASVIKTLNMSNNAFAKSINKSSSAVNFMVEGRSKPSFDVLEAILEKYPQISPAWLVTGEGDMSKESSTSKVVNDSYLQDYLQKLEEQFKRVMNQLETKDRQIEKLMDLLGKLDLSENLPCLVLNSLFVEKRA